MYIFKPLYAFIFAVVFLFQTIDVYANSNILLVGCGKAGSAFVEQFKKVDQANVGKLLVVENSSEVLEEVKLANKGVETVYFFTSLKDVPIEEAKKIRYVQEAVPEDIGVKKEVFDEITEWLDRYGMSDIPVCSNTSSIPASELISGENLKGRVVVNHLLIPFGNVAEVGLPSGLSETDADSIYEQVDSLNKLLNVTSFRLKNSRLETCKQVGHGWNRVWFHIKHEFLTQYGEYRCSTALTDLAFMQVFNKPYGFFLVIDKIGLKTVASINCVWRQLEAFDYDLPDRMGEMIKENARFYTQEDEPTSIDWLIKKSKGQSYLSTIPLNVNPFNLFTQWQDGAEKDRPLKRNSELMEHEELKKVCYGLLRLIAEKFTSEVIGPGVLSLDDADQLFSELTGRENYLKAIMNVDW